MFKKNMGWLDRTVRFTVGVALIPIGLFLLDGWQEQSDRYLRGCLGLDTHHSIMDPKN